jgi:CheY-like chemotaxis protein
MIMAPRSASATPARILIAEDHLESATSLGRLLGLFGYDVAIATNGIDALSTALDFAPAAALIDLTLPDLDGCDVARAMRALTVTRNCRLIAMTGWSGEEHRERARAAGFDVHLVKPVSVELLLRAIVGSSANTTDVPRTATLPMGFAAGSHANSVDVESGRRHSGDAPRDKCSRTAADVHGPAVLGNVRKVR